MPTNSSSFSGTQYYMGSLEFQSHEDASSKGFYLRNLAIRNLWPERMNIFNLSLDLLILLNAKSKFFESPSLRFRNLEFL